METVRPTEGPPSIKIATELTQRSEVAKPFIEPAKQDAGIISSRAQSFLAQTTPDNLRSFIGPLLRPEEDNNISTAEREVTSVVDIWRNGIRGERQIMNLLGDANLLPVSYDNLKKAVEVLERESENLNKGLWPRLTKRGRLNSVRQQLTLARNYLTLYDQTVGPLVTDMTEVNGSVDTAVDVVVDRLDQLAKEEPQQKSSDVEAEVSKEEVLDQLEEQWLERLVVNPLKKAEETFIAKRRKEGEYTDVDEAIDRGNFAQLSQDYIEYIRSRVDAKPRTAKEWEETTKQWVQEDREEVTASFGPFILGAVNKIHRTFLDLGLEDKYWEIAGRLTLYGDNAREIMARGYYWRSDEGELIDLRPREAAYSRWARLVDNFQPPTADWAFPELEQARWSDGHLGKIARALYALPRRRPEPRDDIHTILAEDLTKLPSFDRWLVLKDYLQEKGIVSSQRLDAFENSLILRMVNEVLIPGGHESWPGTAVTSVLRELGSQRALAPLLYYQTYISGASGLYKAGHTNAAAQRSLEALLRVTDQSEIEALNTPKFVKEALATLKDIADQPMGDEYGRSYLTAGLVARKFKEAAQEIKDNYDNPNYKTWLVALLRGMKNSSQPFSQETYDVMLSFLDLEHSRSFQQEVIETLASRIHNQEQLGINTRINPDFPLALDSLEKILKREDFDKSAENFTALYFIINELQQAVVMEGYTEADMARIRLYYGAELHTSVGIPSQEQMAISHEYRDHLVNQLAEWMKDHTLPAETRYVTLQIFDLVGFDYSSTTSDIAQLYNNHELAKRSSERAGQLMWGGLNFLRDINLHGYYECLTDLLLRRYIKYGDVTAKDLIVSAYIENPDVRQGIGEWFKHWAGDVDKYIEQNPEKMHTIFDSLNEQILSGPLDIAEATVKLFNNRTYFRHDRYARDFLLADLDKVPANRRALLFQALVHILVNQEGWIGAEVTKTDGEEYKKNLEFGQETVKLVADKMWGFLDSDDITQQFWAVYTLNLYNESGEKFREVVERLLLATHTLEQSVPGATQTLDKIRDRLNK